MEYVCTINEANMGLQIAAVAKDMMRKMGVNPQVGMNFNLSEEFKKRPGNGGGGIRAEAGSAGQHLFVYADRKGDLLIMRALRRREMR